MANLLGPQARVHFGGIEALLRAGLGVCLCAGLSIGLGAGCGFVRAAVWPRRVPDDLWGRVGDFAVDFDDGAQDEAESVGDNGGAARRDAALGKIRR